MRKRSVLRLSLIAVAATVLSLVGAGRAFADYAPQSNDIVGIGGDTPQYAVDFTLNGDTSGASGFDASATVNRVASFFATPDSNGRSGYTNSVTGGTSVALNPTDVLRAGTNPVLRVSSSGNSILTLLQDTNPQEEINFVSSASEPTAAEQTTAASHGWGYLHVVQIATDKVDVAADTTTNAPAGLSAAELLGIYTGAYDTNGAPSGETTWGEVPGYSGPAPNDVIVPELPASGSSIRTTFLGSTTSDTGLTLQNGGTVPTLASDVKTVEQNDPTAITGFASTTVSGGADNGDPETSADAIVPFSAGRLNLWNSGYFHEPNATSGSEANTGLSSSLNGLALPLGPALTPGVSLLTGTTPDNGQSGTGVGTALNLPITDYVIFRQSDATSTTPLEPGGTRNWVQTLFSNPGGTTPYFANSFGQALITAAGVTASYSDLGNVSSG